MRRKEHGDWEGPGSVGGSDPRVTSENPREASRGPVRTKPECDRNADARLPGRSQTEPEDLEALRAALPRADADSALAGRTPGKTRVAVTEARITDPLGSRGMRRGRGRTRCRPKGPYCPLPPNTMLRPWPQGQGLRANARPSWPTGAAWRRKGKEAGEGREKASRRCPSETTSGGDTRPSVK